MELGRERSLVHLPHPSRGVLIFLDRSWDLEEAGYRRSFQHKFSFPWEARGGHVLDEFKQEAMFESFPL